jgi:hypothetical protein
MNVFYIILAACPILLLGAVAFLLMVTAGIRKADRGDLYAPEASRLAAFARRIIGGGIRNTGEGDD